jgi:hypothetical protein
MNPNGTDEELKTALQFASGQRLAVLATVNPANEPEAAVMGIAVTAQFEISIFQSKDEHEIGSVRP